MIEHLYQCPGIAHVQFLSYSKSVIKESQRTKLCSFLTWGYGDDNTLPILTIYLTQILGQYHSFTGFTLHPASRRFIWLQCLCGSVVWSRDKLPEDCSAQQPSPHICGLCEGTSICGALGQELFSFELGFMTGKGQNSLLT